MKRKPINALCKQPNSKNTWTVEELQKMYDLRSQGKSFREISEETGTGVNTLISRKRYAVLALRENLNELYKLFKNY